MWTSVAVAAIVSTTALAGSASARPASKTETQMVSVNGRSLRVWATGLDRRAPGQPVLILEAGAGAGLDDWAPEAMRQLATLAPVIAYDRHGIGQSQDDTERRTIRRVAKTLHELLQAMRVAPPYVLVGHSWGGLLIRGFAELYGSEVAGLAYVETMDAETTRQELADSLPEAERKSAFDPPAISPFSSRHARGVEGRKLNADRDRLPRASYVLTSGCKPCPVVAHLSRTPRLPAWSSSERTCRLMRGLTTGRGAFTPGGQPVAGADETCAC